MSKFMARLTPLQNGLHHESSIAFSGMLNPNVLSTSTCLSRRSLGIEIGVINIDFSELPSATSDDSSPALEHGVELAASKTHPGNVDHHGGLRIFSPAHSE